eukprot:7376703-Prymnesium_polylepis.2
MGAEHPQQIGEARDARLVADLWKSVERKGTDRALVLPPVDVALALEHRCHPPARVGTADSGACSHKRASAPNRIC